MALDLPFKLSGRYPKRLRVPIAADHVEAINALCKEARYFDAWKVAEPLGSPQSWDGIEARLTGSILANQTGAGRLSDLLDLSCFREAPLNPDAQYGYLITLRNLKGPLAAWRVMRRMDIDVHPPEQRAALLSFKALIAEWFRDFDAAEECLRIAREMWPDPAWNLRMRAWLLHAQDEIEPALEAALASLEARPWYQPALVRAVELYKSLNRIPDAIELIRESFKHVQIPGLASTLAGIYREREEFEAMFEPLELYSRWSPMMEPPVREWYCCVKAEAYYHCGDLQNAAAFAAQGGNEFQRDFAERLRSATAPGRRVRLPVAFIRQRHHTCAPATLAALASFWGMPAAEKEIAEDICYDGTYDLHQRRWAEEAGFFVREFRVTWESTRELINRGIPFAVVTSSPANAHLQAVIGYDELRTVLLIREPSEHEYEELIIDNFYQSQAAVGPRGMAFVPQSKRSLLAEADLPETHLYDLLYQINLSLEKHERAHAIALCDEIEAAAPNHRLALSAHRLLAEYDSNIPRQLTLIERLLEQYPGDERLELSRIFCLRDLAQREVRLKALERLSAKPNVHAVFWREYATELADDARDHREALRYLWRAHRANSKLGSVVVKMADIYWDQRQREFAAELYRFAFCTDDKIESRARSFFVASRHVRKTDQALDFLRRRFEAYGNKSGDPAKTLFRALDDLDRTGEGLEVLEKAIQLRPSDAILLLFAADEFGRYNRWDRAAELLQMAGEISQSASWLKTSARLAQYKGEPARALDFWKRVIELEPLAMEAHEEISRLLEQTEGRESALRHLRETCDRFPHNLDITKLWLERLREKSEPETEQVARRLVEINPAYAWARRELATVLASAGKIDEARAEAAIACRLNPLTTYAHSIIGMIERKLGNFLTARESFRQALRLSVENSYAMENLIAICPNANARREELAFVHGELIRQVLFGDGLLTFRTQAQGVLDPEELLATLKNALDARPDLWQAWCAVTYQLVTCERIDEALAMAQEMTCRFPLTPGSWRTTGGIHEMRGDWAEAAAAHEQAVSISPIWTAAVCDLSDAHERAGNRHAAIRVLEQALVRNPLDYRFHGCLALLLKREGKNDAALDHLRTALGIDPDYAWAWDRLRDWGSANEALDMARRLTVLRGGDARSWTRLADLLDKTATAAQRLEAIEKALALDPQFTDAHDAKATLLCSEKRYDEAIAACDAPVWQGNIPTMLRGRASWIQAERGDRREAIRMMRAVVADDETYNWGWERLADWLEDEREYVEALSAAEKLVRWQPKQAYTYGYRGHARLNVGDRYGALADFKHAIDMDRAYTFAGWKLFKLQLEDDETDAAAETVDIIRSHSEEYHVLEAETKIALRRRCIEAAASAFRKYASCEKASSKAIEELFKEFRDAGAVSRMDRILHELFQAGTVSYAGATFWAKREVAKGNVDLLPAIEKVMEKEDAVHGAVYGWLDALGDAGRRPPRWRRLVRRHAEWMRQDTFSWGILGYALTRASLYGAAIDWLRNWESMKDCEPWMLTNLMGSLRARGRDEAAAKVSRWVVNLGRSNAVGIVHRCYLAVDEAIANNVDEVASLLKPVHARELSPADAFVVLCAESIVKVLKAKSSERRIVYLHAVRELRAGIAKCGRTTPAVQNTWRRTVRKMGKEAGILLPWWRELKVRQLGWMG
jgi:tetratricopeptide (TPR) repeat protein